MAAIYHLLIFSLSASIGGLQISDSLLTFSSQNPNDPLLFTTVHVFVYFLIPLTFFLSMLLLPCHLTQTTSPWLLELFNNLTMVTRAFSFVTLLLGVSFIATYSYSIPIYQGTLCLCLAAIMIYIGLIHHAPPLFAVCISVGALLFAQPLLSFTQQLPYNPMMHIPIGLLSYILIPFTFMLGITLLFIHVAIPGFSVEPLDMAVRGMVIITLLVGAFVVAY